MAVIDITKRTNGSQGGGWQQRDPQANNASDLNEVIREQKENLKDLFGLKRGGNGGGDGSGGGNQSSPKKFLPMLGLYQSRALSVPVVITGLILHDARNVTFTTHQHYESAFRLLRRNNLKIVKDVRGK